jgi:hypothetical protein
MPQIIINRPPGKSARAESSKVGLAADVTVTDGGAVVNLPSTDYVRITVTQGQTVIQTEDDTQK